MCEVCDVEGVIVVSFKVSRFCLMSSFFPDCGQSFNFRLGITFMNGQDACQFQIDVSLRRGVTRCISPCLKVPQVDFCAFSNFCQISLRYHFWRAPAVCSVAVLLLSLITLVPSGIFVHRPCNNFLLLALLAFLRASLIF